MRTPVRSTRAGSTLLEVILAATLFVLIAASAVTVVDAAVQGYRTETVSAQLDSLARELLDEISEHLRGADLEAVTPPGVKAPASTSLVDFQRALGFQNDAVLWGPTERLAFEYDPGDPDNGADDDGDGLIDEGRVVWIENPGAAGERRAALCSWVREWLEGETPGNALDDNGNGLVDERGFCLDFAGSRATVRLSLERRDRDGHAIVHTVSRAVTLRNTPEG